MSTDRSSADPKPVKITVSDRRHHARADADADAEAGSDRSPYPTLIEELKARAEAAERRTLEARDEMEAEIEAVRERLNRDVERRVGEGKADLLGPLLDVLDNIQRAAGVAGKKSASIGKGVGLIGQQLQGLLKQQGVEPIETVGKPYDPHVAEAVVIEQVETERHDIVIEELQTGYRFGETILRPARVKVGKSG